MEDMTDSGNANGLLSLFLESLTDYAIFTLDPEGNVTSWNAGAERLKGYSEAEILGKNFSIFYPQVDIDAGKPAAELGVAARVGQVEDEGWRIRKDGTRFWANVVITAVRDEQGTLVGYGKVTRDLTPRKLHEDALKDELIDTRSELAGLIRNIGALQNAMQTIITPKVDQLERVVVPRSEHRRRRIESTIVIALFLIGLGLGLLRSQQVASHSSAADRRSLHVTCLNQAANRTVLLTLIDTSAETTRRLVAANTNPALAEAYAHALENSNDFQALGHHLLPPITCP